MTLNIRDREIRDLASGARNASVEPTRDGIVFDSGYRMTVSQAARRLGWRNTGTDVWVSPSGRRVEIVERHNRHAERKPGKRYGVWSA